MASTLTRLAFFDDREAWLIFRLAAFGEAIGWTLLISGITYKHFGWPNGPDVLKILGQTHGTLFFAYIAAVLAVAVSLRLSRTQFLIAAAMSVPPYGTLMYEKYLAHKRQREAAKSHREIVVRAVIRDGQKLLAVQPKRGTFWCLPGGKVEASESSAAALVRLIKESFGVTIKIGPLILTHEYSHHGQLRLELYYAIPKVTNLSLWHLTPSGTEEYDEVALINPKQTTDLRPTRLQTI